MLIENQCGVVTTPSINIQVHDELVFEVRLRDVHRVAAIVRECMEHAVVLNVPLQVKLSTGSSWGSLSPLLPPTPTPATALSPGIDMDTAMKSGANGAAFNRLGGHSAAVLADAGAGADTWGAASTIARVPSFAGSVATGPSSLFATVVGASDSQSLHSLQPLQAPLFGYPRAGAAQNAPPPQVASRAGNAVTAVVRDLFGKD